MRKFKIKAHLSNQCNLKCYYCTIDQTKRKKTDFDKLINFLEKNKDSFDTHIKVLGGEPTTFITDRYINLIKKYFKTINFTSNFTNMNFVEKYYNDENITYLASYNGEKDDSTKTKGKIIENIQKYRNRIEAISMVINKDTIKELPKIVKLGYMLNTKVITIPEVQYNIIPKDREITQKEWDECFEQLYKDGTYPVMKSLQEYLSFSPYNDECKYCNVTIGWDDNIYPCSLYSDMFNPEFSKNSYGDLEYVNLQKLDYSCINKLEKRKIISYDGTDCLKCNKCNFLCEIDNLLGGGKASQIKCTYGRNLFNFFYNREGVKERIMEYCNSKELQIEQITLMMTEDCNMACKYCFEKYAGNAKIKSMMSNEIIEKAINLLLTSEYKEPTIQFFGGEPTLNVKGLKHAIEYYKTKKHLSRHKLHFQIQSNLYEITDELINIFKEMEKHTVFSITVSMDSNKKIHDMNRIDKNGKPTFDKILKNISILRKEFPNLFINQHIVISKDTIKYFEEIIENYHKLKHEYFDQISFVLCDPDMDSEEKQLTKDDLEPIVKFYYEKILPNHESYCEDFLNNFYLIGCEPIFGVENKDKISTCGAGERTITVRPDGTMLPCHKYIDIRNNIKNLGNILNLKQDVIMIQKDSEWENKYLISNNFKKELTSELGYKCAECGARHLCHFCLASNEICGKNIYVKSKNVCRRTTMIAELALKYKEIQLLQETNMLLEDQNKMLKEVYKKTINIATETINTHNKITNIIGDDNDAE